MLVVLAGLYDACAGKLWCTLWELGD